MAEQEGEKQMSKSALKKQQKEAEKAALKAKKAAAQPQGVDMSQYAELCGSRPVVEEKPEAGKARVYTRVEDLLPAISGTKVWVRGRVHHARPASGGLVFLVLRQRWATVQVVVEEGERTGLPRPVVKWVSKLKSESIIDIYATVSAVNSPIAACSQHDVELLPHNVFIISSASDNLPLRVQDASVPLPEIEAQQQEVDALNVQLEEAHAKLSALPPTASSDEKAAVEALIADLTNKKGAALKVPDVDQSTRLDNRIIDLRTTANQAIFTIQSAVVNLFRDFLNSKGFTEIHSPKLINAASEGGAEVFEVKYFDRRAFLAQSPQFYKQMAISADFERVYEIGPVFRAEKAMTHRHMTEFTGLDLEMTIQQHYHEVTDLLGDLFVHIFSGIETKYSRELVAISQQYPFRPFKYLKNTLRIEYPEAIALLRQAGVTIGDFDDMNTEKERILGKAVYEKYGTDFYIVDRFPSEIRPFYSMVCPKDPKYANAYDLFMRGEEVCSGAQRVHDPEMLTARASAKGVDPKSVQEYIDAFKYGAPPHGGGGVGLDRVVMLYLGLNNIRKTALFPRDPYRLTP